MKKRCTLAIILTSFILFSLSNGKITQAEELTTESSVVTMKSNLANDANSSDVEVANSEVERTDEADVTQESEEQETEQAIIIEVDELEKVEKDMQSFIASETNTTEKETLDIENIDYSVEVIRNGLLSIDGIDTVLVNSYSEKQLLESFAIFKRYNYDYTGMDFGGYYRLLQTLYVDKTVDLTAALAQLSAFNPSEVGGFVGLKEQINALQTYLSILYPTNSSFFAIPKLTNQELTNILDYLIELENKVSTEKQMMPAGPIGMISYRVKHLTTENGKDDKKTTSLSTAESTVATTTSTSNKAISEPDKKVKGTLLPQTGAEKTNWALAVGGIAILGITVGVYLKKRKA